LFGVSIEKREQTIKGSASLDNIASLDDINGAHHVDPGYSSDGVIGSKRGRTAYTRKKGTCVIHLLHLIIHLFVTKC
jgi:hypothetical protein